MCPNSYPCDRQGEDRRLLRSLPPTKCSVAGIVAKEKERAYAILSSNPAIRISMSNKSSEEGHASELDQVCELLCWSERDCVLVGYWPVYAMRHL